MASSGQRNKSQARAAPFAPERAAIDGAGTLKTRPFEILHARDHVLHMRGAL